ncbi:type I toxin-antitoxin system Ibs family toxin [Escherichia coli O132:H11]|nr:type I toxin-antitoxin system Ibs family toxin [Escherichia coli]
MMKLVIILIVLLLVSFQGLC